MSASSLQKTTLHPRTDVHEKELGGLLWDTGGESSLVANWNIGLTIPMAA